MKRLIPLVVAGAIAVGVFAGTGSARNIVTCVQSLNGVGNALTADLIDEGVTASTVPGTFTLPGYLSDDLVTLGVAVVGACPTPPPTPTPTPTPAATTQYTPPPSNIFLCYSAFQTDPGVWSESQARSLYGQGYWLPYAAAGNVTGGTNIGSFHLVCNLAGTQSVTTSFAGEDGTVLGPSYKGVFGIYPMIGSAG